MKTKELLDKLDDLALDNLALDQDNYDDQHSQIPWITPQTPKGKGAYYREDTEDMELDLDYYTDTLYGDILRDSSDCHSSSNSILSSLVNTSPASDRQGRFRYEKGKSSGNVSNSSTIDTIDTNTNTINTATTSTITPRRSPYLQSPKYPPRIPSKSKPLPSIPSTPSSSISPSQYIQSLQVLNHGIQNNKLVLDCMQDMIIQENNHIIDQLDQLVNDIEQSVPNNTFVVTNLMK